MKRFVIFILSFLVVCNIFSQTAERPKVAVVLSGGGAKGFAHIGALKVLEEEGIPIDIIVGTSMGSIVGGLYSIGYSADQIAQMSLEENWPQLLSDYVPRKQLDNYSKIEQQRYVLTLPVLNHKPELPNGMVKGQNVINLFCGLAANVPLNADFNQFPVAFACVGTDLATGEERVLNSGFLPTAIFSSMAIPGVFAPGEHNGHVLVDGGIVNNFPTDVAKKMGADIIIGVDLRGGLLPAGNITTLKDLSGQLISFYTLSKDSLNKSLCDVTIRPDMNGYGTSSFYTEAVDTLIRRGREAAYAVIDQIEELKTRYSLHPESISDRLIEPNEWQITKINFAGHYSMTEKLLIDVLKLNIPGRYSYREIKKAINYLYGMGVFKRIYFNLTDNEQGKTLNIYVEEEKATNINVGMRLNSKSVVSVVLNFTQRDYTKKIARVSFTGDISTSPWFSFQSEINNEKLPDVVFQVDGAYSDLSIHLTKDYSYPAEIFEGAAKLYTYQRILKYSMLGAGLKQEHYKGKLYNIVSDSSLTLSANQRSVTSLYGFISFDNLDDYYFPTKGGSAYTEVSFAKDFKSQSLNPILLFTMRDATKLNRNLTLLTNIYARSLLKSTTPVFLENYVAAQDYEINYGQHLSFYGLPSLWSTERTTVIGRAGLRMNVYRKNYVTLATNYLLHNNEISHIEDYKSIWGFGFTYAYKSPVGPVEFTLGYSDAYKKVIASGNIGFWF